MQDDQSQEYRGYTITVNTGTAPGKFVNAFVIHEHIISRPPIALPLAHQRRARDAEAFSDREKATESAFTIARKWIDAHGGD